MRLTERELELPVVDKHHGLLSYLAAELKKTLGPNETPIRFVISKTTGQTYHCEIGVLDKQGADDDPAPRSIFDFQSRRAGSSNGFNAVVIIPTGIGADIGGHAGDANRVIRLLATVCDQLITHPNAVNAADINEMPDNGLYVEGSVLCRLLMGTVGLQKVRSNRLLVIADDLTKDTSKPGNKLFTEAVTNAVSAARATLGLECTRIVLMKEPIAMQSEFASSGRAVGIIDHMERLIAVVDEFKEECDAIALSTVVNVNDDVFEAYYQGAVLNPWGGVEAMLTHAITSIYDLPAAHAPMLDSIERMNVDLGVVDPRMAAEVVSLAAFHSVLKGLHKSPRVVPLGPTSVTNGLITASDISCLVTPDGCFGLPHLAAIEQGIPVIAVRDGQQTMKNNLENFPFASLHFADNYLEAAGILSALREGIDPTSIKEPLQEPKNLVVEWHRKSCEQLPGRHESSYAGKPAETGKGGIDKSL